MKNFNPVEAKIIQIIMLAIIFEVHSLSFATLAGINSQNPPFFQGAGRRTQALYNTKGILAKIGLRLEVSSWRPLYVSKWISSSVAPK